MRKYLISYLCIVPLLFAGIVTAHAEPSAVVSLDPPNYQGKCPVSVMVKAKITSTSAGNVSFGYVFSTGYKTNYETIHFDAPGTIDFDKGLVAGAPSLPQYPTSGWVAIEIGGKLSNKAVFNITCKDPDIAVIDLKWIPYSTQYKTAPIPLGSIIVDYKNKGTGNTGPVQLTLLCEGVPGTGPFGETPFCPAGIFPKTFSPISTDVAPGEGSQTGIVGSGGSMPPSWGGGKYKISAEMKLLNGNQETDSTNNKKELDINVPFAVMTDVNTIMITGSNYKDVCSESKNITLLSAKIAGNGYGVIKYQWIIDGVASGSVQEMTYRVEDILKEIAVIVLPINNKSGWGAIKIISPGSKESQHASYSIECTGSSSYDLSLGKYKIAFSNWKTLGNLSAAPQACQECASTANQIGGIDQKSLLLVQKGESLTGRLSSGGLSKAETDSIMQQLNSIEQQLNANMAQRKMLVDQYNRQRSGFNMQPRKATPVRK